MSELFSNYSLGQIIIFAIILALAIKELIAFLDWANQRMHKKVNKDRNYIGMQQQIDTLIQDHTKDMEVLTQKREHLEDKLDVFEEKLNLLIASDKDSIKAWITAQHHHFMEKGTIDYYSYDCISKRYQHYKAEGGNTFVDDLMEDINNLPKTGTKIKNH